MEEPTESLKPMGMMLCHLKQVLVHENIHLESYFFDLFHPSFDTLAHVLLCCGPCICILKEGLNALQFIFDVSYFFMDVS